MDSEIEGVGSADVGDDERVDEVGFIGMGGNKGVGFGLGADGDANGVIMGEKNVQDVGGDEAGSTWGRVRGRTNQEGVRGGEPVRRTRVMMAVDGIGGKRIEV